MAKAQEGSASDIVPLSGPPIPFGEHNTEADLWANKVAKGRVEEWVDTTRIEWQEVAGLCGFWDESCDSGTTRMSHFLQKVWSRSGEEFLIC